MLGNAKLVMRGGFGIFYDIEDGALNLQFGGQPPFGYVSNNTPNTYAGVIGDTPGTGPSPTRSRPCSLPTYSHLPLREIS